MSRVDAAAFRDALSRFASGVTVVTVRGADGDDHGMTVSAFASLSLDPPLVIACLDVAATALPPLRASGLFGVSILAAGQHALSTQFAVQDTNRFAGAAVTRSPEGPLLIDGAAAHLVCRVTAEHPGGDHVIVVGEVLTVRVHGDDPLLYVLRQYRRLAPRTDG